MYTRLTKKIIIDGRECVSCAYQDTEECPIHTNTVSNCSQCKIYAAVLNQLCAFEDIVCGDNPPLLISEIS